MTRLALVTGATGGLGRTLVPALRTAGWTVRATGRRPAVGEVAADLTAPLPKSLVDGVDAVFHLAARSSPWGERSAFEAINVDATARLVAAAAAAGCRRFVHVSTPSIYAEPRDRLELTEAAAPAKPFANDYARTKWRGEQIVLAADRAMRTVVLRPRAIVGPDDTVLLPRLRRLIQRERVALPGGGAAAIELTDVRDVAAALIAAADAPVGGEAFNISGGAPRPLRWIVEHVAGALGLPVRVVAIPRSLAMAGASLLEAASRFTGREPVVTRYGAMVAGWSQTIDLSAARNRLGWAPSIAPEEAIAHALGGGL